MMDSRKNLIYRFAFIAILILAVYGNTLKNGFVWDDIEIIVENPLLKNLDNLPKLLLSEDRLSDAPSGYYRPVTYLSFSLDRAVWGLNPLGYNLTNILLHILVTLLFYRVVAALFKQEKLAFVAALLFSLHPVAGETVNFHAGGRNTLLCACFALLSLLFYINKKQLPAVACFTIAIFSKEFALLLPGILFLYDRYLSEDKKKWTAYLPYAMSIAGYLACRSFVVAKANPLTLGKLTDNLSIIPQVVAKYIVNMAFPVKLGTIYDIVPGSAITTITYILIVTTAVGLLVFFRKKQELAAASMWFFLFLLPVSNIIPLGSSKMADRYAYFSLMGFCLLAAYCINKANSRLVIIIMSILCICFSVIDIQRNRIWHNDLTFFTQMTKDAPDMVMGFQNLGMFYYSAGDLTSAEKYLSTAYTKNDVTDKTIHTLAAIYWETDRLNKAVPIMLKSIEADPENPQSYIMLNRIYERMGEKDLAKKYHDKALALFPNVEKVMSVRAGVLCKEGEQLSADRKPMLAERKFKEALMMKPDFVPALIDLGSVSAEKGDLPKSVEYFTKAAALDSLNPSVHYNLSMTYEMMGKTGDSKEEMRKFSELDARARQAVHDAGSHK